MTGEVPGEQLGWSEPWMRFSARTARECVSTPVPGERPSSRLVAGRCWSPGCAGRAAGVPANPGDDLYRHSAEHALHTGTHVADGDRLHLVVPQEPCHPGVMGALGALVVQRSPGDSELLPVADLAVGHVGDRDAVSTSPPQVDLAVGGDRHTHLHVECLLAGTGVLG